MRLLHAADIHLGLTRYGHPTARGNSRIDDFALTLEHAVDAAIGGKADLLVLAGDTFDSRHERPEERAILVGALRRAWEAGIIGILLEGNHDGRRVVGDPYTSSLRWLGMMGEHDGLIVVTEPTQEALATHQGELIVLSALPYPHKRSLDRQILEERPDTSPGDRVVEAGRRLDRAIRVMAEQAREKGPYPSLFVGHLTVGGATTGTERSMRFEDDVAVSPDAFDGFDYAALGHIHRQQPIGARAWYAGSPNYIDFGEEGDPKGFLLVDVQMGKPPAVTKVGSGARPVVTLTATQRETGSRSQGTWLIEPGFDDVQGAIVRLRVLPVGPLPIGAAEKLRDKVLESGASYVKTEVVRKDAPTPRIQVEAELDPMEATRRYLASKGTSGADIEAAMRMAADLAQ